MTFPSQLWAMTPMSMGYINKVLKPNSSIGYDPSSLVGFWPQNEKSGLVSIDHSGLGHHGAYTGVDLGQAGVPGMGMTSPFYDGVNDFNNLYSAGFANDNGLLNPGFETPGAMPPTFLNWVDVISDGAIASEAVIVHEGAASAKITAGVLTNTALYQTHLVNVGERRRVRFWTRGDGVNAGQFVVYDQAWNPIIPLGSTGVSAAAWGMVEQEYTVPVGVTSIIVSLRSGWVNGAVCYFDACEDRRMNGFLGDKGTIIVPLQVANVGVWTDGIWRRAIIFQTTTSTSFVFIEKSVANNQILFRYDAGAVTEIIVHVPITELGYFFAGMTWDISAGATGEVRAFIDGLQTGATEVTLGTWVDDLLNTSTLIGANTTAPGAPWLGNTGPALVYNEAKSPAEMAYLMTP